LTANDIAAAVKSNAALAVALIISNSEAVATSPAPEIRKLGDKLDDDISMLFRTYANPGISELVKLAGISVTTPNNFRQKSENLYFYKLSDNDVQMMRQIESMEESDNEMVT